MRRLCTTHTHTHTHTHTRTPAPPGQSPHSFSKQFTLGTLFSASHLSVFLAGSCSWGCVLDSDIHSNLERSHWCAQRKVMRALLMLLLSHFSRVRLCATPSLGFSRLEHWSALPFPSPMHKSEKWKWSHSVMSDSSRPQGLQPTRLLCPWDFPGKSTGVGCHCLLQMRALTMYDII